MFYKTLRHIDRWRHWDRTIHEAVQHCLAEHDKVPHILIANTVTYRRIDMAAHKANIKGPAGQIPQEGEHTPLTCFNGPGYALAMCIDNDLPDEWIAVVWDSDWPGEAGEEDTVTRYRPPDDPHRDADPNITHTADQSPPGHRREHALPAVGRGLGRSRSLSRPFGHRARRLACSNLCTSPMTTEGGLTVQPGTPSSSDSLRALWFTASHHLGLLAPRRWRKRVPTAGTGEPP